MLWLVSRTGLPQPSRMLTVYSIGPVEGPGDLEMVIGHQPHPGSTQSRKVGRGARKHDTECWV